MRVNIDYMRVFGGRLRDRTSILYHARHVTRIYDSARMLDLRIMEIVMSRVDQTMLALCAAV